MKKLFNGFFAVATLTSSLAFAGQSVELSGENESFNLTASVVERKTDKTAKIYDGACYVGSENIRFGSVIITKDKYITCQQAMQVPTCNIKTEDMLTQEVSYKTVCGLPLLSSDGRYYYGETCEKKMTVKYCIRKVTVEQDIEVNVINYTGKSGQSLELKSAKEITTLNPQNTYYALKSTQVKRTDLDQFNAQEKIKHEVVIMDAKTISDFSLSEIKKDKEEFSLEFSPMLKEYRDHLIFDISVTRKQAIGSGHVDVKNTKRDVPTEDNFLVYDFKADEAKKRDHRLTVTLDYNKDKYELLSTNPNYKNKNVRVKAFVPAKN